MPHVDRTPPPTIRRRCQRLRACAARLLLLAPLAAASAQAATSYAISYFSLPGASVTTLWDIDNQGRLLGDAATDLSFSDYRHFLIDNGATQTLTAPNGRPASGTGFSETGLIVGGHDDPTRTYTGITYVWDEAKQIEVPQPYTANVGVGFIRDAAGQWRSLEAPAAGVRSSLLRAVSPDGRHVVGFYNIDGGSGYFVHDRQTNASTLIPGSAGLLAVGAIDNSGRLIGSGTDRKPLIYDPATGQRSVLSDQGFLRLSPRAVNASGQLAGWLSLASPEGNLMRAWVSDGSGINVLQTRPGSSYVLGMNDLGQAVGAWSNPDGTEQQGFIATPVALPEAGGPPGVFSFSVAVRADQPVFIDPLVAVGYDYAVGAGDPLFKTVSLPVGIGDGRYTLSVGGQTLEVAGNQIIDFTALGFAQGVAGFRVTGIETAAMLDPTDASAFVTRLTFVADGRFTGTQTALSVEVPAVPEPASAALWLLGLAGLAAWRQRTRPHPGS